MNRKKKILVSVVLTTLSGVLVVATVVTANLYIKKADAKTLSICKIIGADHTIIIKDSHLSPVATTGKQCDRLTIVNDDNETRLIAFGPHEHHVAYDGISEQLLNYHQSLTLTLISVGSFQFHDHLNDSVRGTFSVSPQP